MAPAFVFYSYFSNVQICLKIMQSKNCILRASYECLYHICENTKKYHSSWVSFIRNNYTVSDLLTYGMIKIL